MLQIHRSVPLGHHGLHHLSSQGVDEPGLAPGELEGAGFGRVGEDLSGGRRVLIVEGRYLVPGEIRQT